MVSYGDFHKSRKIEYDWFISVIKWNFCGTFKYIMKLLKFQFQRFGLYFNRFWTLLGKSFTYHKTNCVKALKVILIRMISRRTNFRSRVNFFLQRLKIVYKFGKCIILFFFLLYCKMSFRKESNFFL